MLFVTYFNAVQVFTLLSHTKSILSFPKSSVIALKYCKIYAISKQQSCFNLPYFIFIKYIPENRYTNCIISQRSPYIHNFLKISSFYVYRILRQKIAGYLKLISWDLTSLRSYFIICQHLLSKHFIVSKISNRVSEINDSEAAF